MRIPWMNLKNEPVDSIARLSESPLRTTRWMGTARHKTIQIRIRRSDSRGFWITDDRNDCQPQLSVACVTDRIHWILSSGYYYPTLDVTECCLLYSIHFTHLALSQCYPIDSILRMLSKAIECTSPSWWRSLCDQYLPWLAELRGPKSVAYVTRLDLLVRRSESILRVWLMVCNEAKAYFHSLSLKNINFILKNGLSENGRTVCFADGALQFPSDLSVLLGEVRKVQNWTLNSLETYFEFDLELTRKGLIELSNWSHPYREFRRVQTLGEI